ncbi:uncharacterized protein LOC122919592 isoform X2 [Bufo gargarizans]|uniref:uncharacterized protein LOC122919592 isoform X2 n=1 Tax=Bufo gargarizans TaxID=30331 RepID=UPI001CF3C5B6|nr:uncharacterized protein LOC122919592 isoform X2 [Bufo gargarizans]
MAAGNHTDPLVTEAYQLARDYIAYVTGRSKGPPSSAAALALCHAGDELLEKFPIFFKRWPRVFKGLTEDRACDFLIETIDENVQGYWDRQMRHPGYPADIPWSTVLSIYVLAGQMAIYCHEHGMDGVLDPLTERVGAYVEEHICPVLQEKGGWGCSLSDQAGAAGSLEARSSCIQLPVWLTHIVFQRPLVVCC